MYFSNWPPGTRPHYIAKHSASSVSLSHAGLIMSLQLEGAAITLDSEGGMVLVLLGGSDLLHTDHLVNVNEPGADQ